MSTAYIGTKRVTATPMTRLAYNEHRGWKLPEDENGADDGFLVQYENGYITWSPRDVFEESYRPNTAMTFGLAVEALKMGKRVTRPSWNGKGMWLVMVGVGHYDVGIKTLGESRGDLAPWIGMNTAQGLFTPWAPAQSDVLAEDWQMYGEVAPSRAFRVSLPVVSSAMYNLYDLCQGLAEEDPLDLTDSILSVQVVKVVNGAGLQFVAHFGEGPVSAGMGGRETVINGLLNNAVNFGLVVDKERFNAKLSSSVAPGVDHDLFLEVEVMIGNHNRR